MGIRDAKTVLKTPAVKRRSENIADLPTGPAKAVKRKATAKPFRDVVKWVNRLHVLRRAGLLNARGNKESGWVVRAGTFIQKVDRYEVAFQNGPRADQRLMVVAALILGDAWTLMDVQRERRTRHSDAPALMDLLEAFDPD